jgi:hypothetical protein
MQLTFCIFLPMYQYQFAHFVGKMTQRPGDHRQIEPASSRLLERYAYLLLLEPVVTLLIEQGYHNINTH